MCCPGPVAWHLSLARFATNQHSAVRLRVGAFRRLRATLSWRAPARAVRPTWTGCRKVEWAPSPHRVQQQSMEGCCWMVSLPPKHLPMRYARAASRLCGFSLAGGFCPIPAAPTRQPIVPKIVDRGTTGAPRTALIGCLCPTTSVSSPLPAPAGSFPVLETRRRGKLASRLAWASNGRALLGARPARAAMPLAVSLPTKTTELQPSVSVWYHWDGRGRRCKVPVRGQASPGNRVVRMPRWVFVRASVLPYYLAETLRLYYSQPRLHSSSSADSAFRSISNLLPGSLDNVGFFSSSASSHRTNGRDRQPSFDTGFAIRRPVARRHCITRFVGVYPGFHLLPAHKLERWVAALSESSNDREGPGPCELSHPFPAGAPPLTAPCSGFLGNIESRCKSPCAAPTQNHRPPPAARLRESLFSRQLVSPISLVVLSFVVLHCRPRSFTCLQRASIHCPVASHTVLLLISAFPVAAASTPFHHTTTQ